MQVIDKIYHHHHFVIIYFPTIKINAYNSIHLLVSIYSSLPCIFDGYHGVEYNWCA